MKIQHIHARVGTFNGSLFFLVDNRLLRVGVGTPNYNDFNEWRLNECVLSTEPYKPEDNEVELEPYEFKNIIINKNDLRMLEFASKLSDMKYEFEDSEFEKLNSDFPDIDPYIAGVMYKEMDRMTIVNKDGETHLSEWVKGDKTSFQKVFYPILEGFREGLLKTLDK